MEPDASFAVTKNSGLPPSSRDNDQIGNEPMDPWRSKLNMDMKETMLRNGEKAPGERRDTRPVRIGQRSDMEVDSLE